MGRIIFIFLLTITHVSLLLSSVIAMNPNKGFSLKMIHIDSKESPLYLGDHITRDERLQRLVEQSRARARYIESQILLESNATHSMNPDAARLKTVYEPGMYYVAKVGLGTFPGRDPPYMNYYLMIDSGSDFTWLQCDGASETFTQDTPLYPWNLSTTFSPVTPDPCNKALCPSGRCNHAGHCTYVAGYISGSVSSGVVAKEMFTLGSNTGALENIELTVGCGLHQENFDRAFGDNHKAGRRDIIAGILGLGRGPWSFLGQLGSVGQGKFSYCFERFNRNFEASKTYLRFGADVDATIGTAARRLGATPLVETGQSRKTYYYLNLEDVSVGDKKVRFPGGTFELNSRGEGGTMIDSGTLISFMYKPHFDRVLDLVKAHFSGLGVDYVGPRQGLDACFEFKGRFDDFNYPPITLHFQRAADYVISDHRSNFIRITENTFCFGYLSENTTTGPAFKLGAMQQANKRIVYDTMDDALYFGDEDCRSDDMHLAGH